MLVNARAAKNIPGRKTDVSDAGAMQPAPHLCRTSTRPSWLQSSTWLEERSRHAARMS